MIDYIKKNSISLLLASIFVLIIIEILLYVYDGYFLGPLIYLFCPLLFIVNIRYLLFIICIGVTIQSIIKHKPWLFFTLSWILLTVLSQIPKEHFVTLGALLSINSANPTQVRDDARKLFDEYSSMTDFGDFPHRIPLNHPLPKDKLPSSIIRVHIGDVLIMDNYILMEKKGLEGFFRGFVVFRNGTDLWKNDNSIILQDTCNTCWKIRITDGLYWYSANPLNPPIFISPLQ